MYQISGYTTNQGTLSKFQDIHVPDFRIHLKLVYTKYQEYACYVTYDVPHFATRHKSEYTKYQDTLNIRIYMYQIQDTPQIRIQQISGYTCTKCTRFRIHHKSGYSKYQDTTNIRIYMYQISGYNKV